MEQARHCFVDFDAHNCYKDDGSTASNLVAKDPVEFNQSTRYHWRCRELSCLMSAWRDIYPFPKRHQSRKAWPEISLSTLRAASTGLDESGRLAPSAKKTKKTKTNKLVMSKLCTFQWNFGLGTHSSYHNIILFLPESSNWKCSLCMITK